MAPSLRLLVAASCLLVAQPAHAYWGFKWAERVFNAWFGGGRRQQKKEKITVLDLRRDRVFHPDRELNAHRGTLKKTDKGRRLEDAGNSTGKGREKRDENRATAQEGDIGEKKTPAKEADIGEKKTPAKEADIGERLVLPADQIVKKIIRDHGFGDSSFDRDRRKSKGKTRKKGKKKNRQSGTRDHGTSYGAETLGRWKEKKKSWDEGLFDEPAWKPPAEDPDQWSFPDVDADVVVSPTELWQRKKAEPAFQAIDVVPPATWQIHAASVPKAGDSQEQNQDALALDGKTMRFAIADGATAHFGSRRWAQLLTEEFIRRPPISETMNEWLKPLRKRVAAELKRLQKETTRLKTEASVELENDDWLDGGMIHRARSNGSAATLVGLTFDLKSPCEGGLPWKACALGDSVLFRLRAGEVRRKWPIQKVKEFDNLPALISSLELESNASSRWKVAQGIARPGERFILATDKMAEYIIAALEHGHDPFPELATLTSAAKLHRFVKREREAGRLRDDDVSLAQIVVPQVEALKTAADR